MIGTILGVIIFLSFVVNAIDGNLGAAVELALAGLVTLILALLILLLFPRTIGTASVGYVLGGAVAAVIAPFTGHVGHSLALLVHAGVGVIIGHAARIRLGEWEGIPMIGFGRDPLKATNKAARLAAQATKDGKEVVMVKLRSKDVMLAGSLDDAMEDRGYRFDGWMSPTRAVYRQVHGYLLDSDAVLLPLFKSMPGGRGRAQGSEKLIDVSTPGNRHRFRWDQIEHFEIREADEDGAEDLVIKFNSSAGTGGYTLLIKEHTQAWCAQLKDQDIHQSKGRYSKGPSSQRPRDRDRTIESDGPSVSSGETRTDFNAIEARLRDIEERIAAAERGERPSSELPDLYRLRDHLESQLS